MNSRYNFVGAATRKGPGINPGGGRNFSPPIQTDPPVQMVPCLIPAGKAAGASR